MFTKRNYVFKILTGIANRLNKQRKTQNWGIVVFENGIFREK